jgi:alpha-mannosidase
MDLKPYLKFANLAAHIGKLHWIKRHSYIKIGSLAAEYMVDKEPIPFAERLTRPTKPISAGTVWSNESYGCSWFHFTGSVSDSGKGKHIALMVDIGGEGCVFDKDGNAVAGITDVHVIESLLESYHLERGKKLIEISKSAQGGEELDIWVEGGNNRKPTDFCKKAVFYQASIVIVHDDMAGFFYDYITLLMQRFLYKRGEAKSASIGKALDEAFKVVRNASPEAVEKGRAILQAEYKNGEDLPYYAWATGHAHLDLAWLWPIRETKRKACRTFINQINNIEKYPDYVFGASQPQQFQWMEERYPDVFEKIKKAVAKGNIELQGGMWVECDTNLTSGESLIRQNLYGKKYWKEKFGKDMNFCWLPDVFGFSGNLPQILKKCGIDYFLTIKLSWNEHNKFPHRSFIWEGIDGSSVLVHMPPENNYNGFASPITNMHALDSYPEKDKINVFSVLFGIGDGGGGPSTGHIEMMKRQKDAKGLPKMRLGPAQNVFKDLEAFRENLVKVKGELYLEKHQGTYTTQSNNKFLNRRIEFKLHNVEFLCEAARNAGCPYPSQKLEKIWKEVLLYQFHDIIPGSSIARVYDESVKRYHEMLAELDMLEKKALEYLQGAEKPFAINCTSFAQRELIRRDDGVYEAEVPAYGAAEMVPYESKGNMKATADTLESDFFVIRFNNNGDIVSLYSKKLQKEFNGVYLNKLHVYKDKKLHYNAWDIDWKYMKKRVSEFQLLDSSYKAADGFAIRENIYKFNKSSITQKVILTEGKPVVDFVTIVDWQETHRMLRADFRPSVFSDQVTCDIQMGNLKRSTGDKNSFEKAQFEICSHKWVDVSENGYGLSVLSEGKYGWRVKEGLISLNMLRSPMFPAPDADKGTHTIKYSLYPHSGDFFEAETIKYAYSLNNPLIVSEREVALAPFATIDNKNIVIETIKRSESGEDTVIRLYESAGLAATAKLNVNGGYSQAFETDMLENLIHTVNPEKLVFSPYEIKTLLIRR